MKLPIYNIIIEIPLINIKDSVEYDTGGFGSFLHNGL